MLDQFLVDFPITGREAGDGDLSRTSVALREIFIEFGRSDT
ncbi:hypothetical protein [Streptomyces sp. TRM68367]|nr:hypothetical protein [Streptomyces sp. TRM68367]